jgi:hypothetical protein
MCRTWMCGSVAFAAGPAPTTCQAGPAAGPRPTRTRAEFGALFADPKHGAAA